MTEEDTRAAQWLLEGTTISSGVIHYWMLQRLHLETHTVEPAAGTDKASAGADRSSDTRLFMAPSLVRARSVYKDLSILSFYHTHTHARTHTRTHARTRAHTHTRTRTLQTHALLEMNWYNENLRKLQTSIQNRRGGFSWG